MIRFKSLMHPEKFGYEWTNDSMSFWDSIYRDPKRFLHGCAGMFETYGDNGVQHTPLYAATAERFTDFCLSFAAHLMTEIPDWEKFSVYHLKPEVSTELILFLASIKYKEEKRQWYSAQLCKVSSKESRQHDKRWQEVPRWADGSIASALSLFWLSKEHASRDLLTRLLIQDLFWDALYSKCPQGADWEKVSAFSPDFGDQHDAQSAFTALKYAVLAITSAQGAKRCVETAKFNCLRTRDEAAALQTTTTAAAA